MKKKILFIFVSDEYIRNFYENGIIQKLKKKFHIKFVLEKSNIFKYKHFQNHKDCLGIFNYSKKQVKDFNLFMWSNSIINEKLSKTFRFQNKAIFLDVNFRFFGETIIRSFLFLIPRIFIKLLKLKNYYLIKLKDNNNEIKNKYLNKYSENPIIRTVKNFNPDLIAFPQRGNHTGLFEISNNFRHKTLLMCDNWDNPSSKSYIEPKPKFISVWGKQSKTHAINCNKYKSKNVKVLGTPKYEIFFKNKNKTLKSYFKFKYFLVLESWIYDGMQEALSELNEIISTNDDFKKYKVVFRPYPHRQGMRAHSKKYDISSLKNVIIDPDVKIDENLIVDGRFRTKLSYYPSLIKNAELIVSGPTTMVLESCMFYKKIILIALDGPNYFNHKNTLNNMIHFKGLSKFPNLVVNNDIKDLNSQILNLIHNKKKYKKKEIDKILDFFLTKKAANYSKNLELCFKELITLVSKTY